MRTHLRMSIIMADHQYQCTACSHYSQTGPLILARFQWFDVISVDMAALCAVFAVCHITSARKYNLDRHYEKYHSSNHPPVPTPPGNHVDVSFGGESHDYSDENSESDNSSQETSTCPDDSQSGEGSFHAAEAI